MIEIEKDVCETKLSDFKKGMAFVFHDSDRVFYIKICNVENNKTACVQIIDDSIDTIQLDSEFIVQRVEIKSMQVNAVLTYTYRRD